MSVSSIERKVGGTGVFLIRAYSILTIDTIRWYAEYVGVEIFQIEQNNDIYWFYMCPKERGKVLKLLALSVISQPCLIQKLFDGSDLVMEYLY